MVTKKRTGVDTWKKKSWFTVIAPPSFEEKVIGSTPAIGASDIVGRCTSITLRAITGNVQHQNIRLKFRVTKVKGTKAYTELAGHEIQRSYIERQSKRMRTNERPIFNIKTKDNKEYRVKAMILGRGTSNQKQKKAIRDTVKEFVTEKAKKTPFDKLFQEIVFGKISTELYKKCKLVFPIVRVDIIRTKPLEPYEIAKGAVEEVGEIVVEEKKEKVGKKEIKPAEKGEEKAEAEEKPKKEKEKAAKEKLEEKKAEKKETKKKKEEKPKEKGAIEQESKIKEEAVEIKEEKKE